MEKKKFRITIGIVKVEKAIYEVEAENSDDAYEKILDGECEPIDYIFSDSNDDSFLIDSEEL